MGKSGSSKIFQKLGTFRVTGCFNRVIDTIKHKGLRLLWEKNDPSKLPAMQVDKITRILTSLDTIKTVEPLRKIPGYRLHKLSGDRKGFWSVYVTGNYRIIFQFKDERVSDVNYIDYH